MKTQLSTKEIKKSARYYTSDNDLQNSKEMRIIDNIIKNEIKSCQSYLVDELLAKEVFSYDDIINFYSERCVNCDAENEGVCECGEYESQDHEIYEWWLVSDYFADKAENFGLPVLHNDFGCWWGRTTTGQAIKIDSELWDMFINSKEI